MHNRLKSPFLGVKYWKLRQRYFDIWVYVKAVLIVLEFLLMLAYVTSSSFMLLAQVQATPGRAPSAATIPNRQSSTIEWRNCGTSQSTGK